MYAVSHTNATRLYFASAFQDLMATLFVVLTVFMSKRNLGLSLVVFVAALASKETAVITPLLVGLYLWWQHRTIDKKLIVKLLPFIVLTLLYLYLRFFVFGFSATSIAEYETSFNPKTTANTAMWYLFWMLGLAEMVIHHVGSGLRLLPSYATDFPRWGLLHLGLFMSTVISLFGIGSYFLVRQITTFKNNGDLFWKNFILLFGSIWMVSSLLPILFLPNHKFALSLSLPLIGLVTVTLHLLKNTSLKIQISWLLLFAATNITGLLMTNRSHYTILRSSISSQIHAYFLENELKQNETIYFKNDVPAPTTTWGVSKQINEALLGTTYFEVAYPDKNLIIYYQDDLAAEQATELQEKLNITFREIPSSVFVTFED